MVSVPRVSSLLKTQVPQETPARASGWTSRRERDLCPLPARAWQSRGTPCPSSPSQISSQTSQGTSIRAKPVQINFPQPTESTQDSITRGGTCLRKPREEGVQVINISAVPLTPSHAAHCHPKCLVLIWRQSRERPSPQSDSWLSLDALSLLTAPPAFLSALCTGC